MRTAAYKDLMNLGLPEQTSRDIIREARKIECNAVHLSKSPFDNRRVGIAPAEIVEQLIGIPLSK